jgi:hypothetical protein
MPRSALPLRRRVVNAALATVGKAALPTVATTARRTAPTVNSKLPGRLRSSIEPPTALVLGPSIYIRPEAVMYTCRVRAVYGLSLHTDSPTERGGLRCESARRRHCPCTQASHQLRTATSAATLTWGRAEDGAASILLGADEEDLV